MVGGRGRAVAEDQPLLKVETDKAVVELPSPHSGTVLRLHAAADAAIFVGDPLVTIGEAGEELPEEAPSAARCPSRGAAVATGGSRHVRRRMSPGAGRWRRRAPGLWPGSWVSTCSRLRGSGSGGRITDEDVQRVADGGARRSRPRPIPATSAGTIGVTADGEVERVAADPPEQGHRQRHAGVQTDFGARDPCGRGGRDRSCRPLSPRQTRDRGTVGGSFHAPAALHQGAGGDPAEVPDLQRFG